ncbi:MAG TPA: hypothetical protein P5540_19455 [Candidatus Hydrogenedentes bacterium]|nr:hypothetical protein [Candidatus Hydrogenedentota bacterium]
MLWPFSGIKEARMERESLLQHLESLELRLQESAPDSGLIALSRDEIGWEQITGAFGEPVNDSVRTDYLRLARVYTVRDPLCRQAKELWVNFGVGSGATWATQDAGTERKIKAFWTDPKNRVVFSTAGQRALAASLFVDGEVMLLFFPGNPGRVRMIDPLEVKKIITDPEDIYTEAALVRSYTNAAGVYREAKYAMWDYDGDAMPDGVEPGVWAFHYRLTGTHGRGHSGLIAALDWARAHRQFMKARSVIQQEIAKVVRKLKVKGGPAHVNAARAREQARAAARTSERGATPPIAQTYIENEGQDLQPTAQETGAQAAQVDGNMLLQVFGAGVGIYPHYFGAGEAFRLATSTAMELPMLRTFEAFQAILKQIYSDLILAELDERDISIEDAGITVTLPEPYPVSRQTMLQNINATLVQFPQFGESEDIQKFVLHLLNVPDPQAVLDGYAEAPATESGRMLREFTRLLVKARESKSGSGCAC